MSSLAGINCKQYYREQLKSSWETGVSSRRIRVNGVAWLP